MRAGRGASGAGTRGERGIALVEIAVAVAILAIALLGGLLAAASAARRARAAKELEVAALAARRARENLAAVRFRGATATDNEEWLFRGGFEIARDATGASVLMPDLRSAPTATVDGVGGCVVVDFPVPPLQPPPGRAQPGRIVFYVDETAQPAPLPAAAFPFAPTPGLAGLDCDGDGALATANLRARHAQSARPCRLIPARIEVVWRAGAGGDRGRHVEYFLLAFQGLK